VGDPEGNGRRPGSAPRDADACCRIEAILTDRLSLHVPSTDTDLIAEGLLDSVGFVELLSSLEQEFDVTIPVDKLEVDYFRSVNDIAAFIGASRTSDSRPDQEWMFRTD
jgi:acyl carrier protein